MPSTAAPDIAATRGEVAQGAHEMQSAHDETITRYAAEGRPWATALVAGAMGVRQDFYAPLARYLARHGVHAVTFDYEGIGKARPARLRDVHASVFDWVRHDAGAALEAARSMAPSLPLLYLGHSLGGQVLALVPGCERVRAAVTVTAGSGYWRLNERMRTQLRLFWFLALPLLTPLFGYFPGKRVRIVGDLPRNVAWQWRRWCLHPEYMLCEPGVREACARLELPIRAYSFTDDPMISPHAVEVLHRAFAAARVELREVDPASAGRDAIGHFGFFQPGAEPLWDEALAWLREREDPR